MLRGYELPEEYYKGSGVEVETSTQMEGPRMKLTLSVLIRAL